METPIEEVRPVPVLEIKRRKIPHGKGQLVVHDRYRNGELVDSVFTFDSLTHVLDMPKSTLEGRYSRGRLHKWKVDVPNGFGRPSRGFPLAMLHDVINVIVTRNAKVTTGADEDVVDITPQVRATNKLELVAYQGKRYFTVAALADHFGVSETTIRKKLSKANLTRRLQDLAPSRHGGRPRRGFPESALGDIYLAVNSDAVFGAQVDEVLARHKPVRDAALSYMRENIVPHELPAKNSLRAYDPDTRAPVVPLRSLNGVKSDSEIGDEIADEVQAALENLFLPATAGSTTPARTSAVVAAPDQTTMTPDEEREANLAAAKEWHRNALTESVDEPTPQEYRDTVEILELSKGDAERFIADVKLARRNRESN